MNCPICDFPIALATTIHWRGHTIGDRRVCYDKNLDGSFTTRVFDIIIGNSGKAIGVNQIIKMDGLVFFDEKRIEKLLLLK